MKPRVNIDELLTNTISNARNGNRDIRDQINEPYYLDYSMGTFISFCLKSGIVDVIDDLDEIEQSYFSKITPITLFLSGNTGYINKDSSLVTTATLGYFPVDSSQPVVENKKFQDYVRSMISGGQ